VLRMSEPDEAPAPDPTAGRPRPETLREVLENLDHAAAYVREVLPTIDDNRMRDTFTVVQNGKTLLALPRQSFLRMIMLNHWYHHRGQLGVYLRLLGAKVPSSYGPSGDEMPRFE
jgi:uncharacterized damage-inducible protein DinB